jgi:hypothetical protein
MNAAFMQLERHGSGIHTLSSAALKPKFGYYCGYGA